MSVSEGIVVFVMLWWLTLFVVLPFGVRKSEVLIPGQDAGAPDRPRLARTAIWTTAIAAILWGIFYAVAVSGLISFRPAP